MSQTGEDLFRRFLLENADIRGVHVRLTDAWRKMLDKREYAPATARLLGEMTTVTALIAGQLKTPGRLTFQLRGSGPIQLLVIDCDEQLRLRGMARAAGLVPEANAAELLGHGQLMMTLDLPEARHPIQSYVPLEGDSIAAIFEHYLEQSEQAPTRLLLAANENAAAGLFLQKLPDADAKDADGWERIGHLLATVKPEELLELDGITLLSRLFSEEDVRVYEPQPIRHHCPEDWPKIHSMLRALGKDELQAILDEHGEIVVSDDICNRQYRLGPEEVVRLLSEDPPTLH